MDAGPTRPPRPRGRVMSAQAMRYFDIKGGNSHGQQSAALAAAWARAAATAALLRAGTAVVPRAAVPRRTDVQRVTGLSSARQPRQGGAARLPGTGRQAP